MRRRQFLRGLGGMALAIPFLPSLLPRTAESAPGDMPKRFIALATDHGGIWTKNMYPDAATLQDTRMYAGHEIRRGSIARRVESGRTIISPVLSASSEALTESLVDKMNIIQGVDIPFYIAHHTGGHLGNYARNDGNGGDGQVVQAFPKPTIDQVMAWSREFYPDLEGVLERSMVVGGNRMSYGYANPSMQTGAIQEVSATTSSMDLFRRIFLPNETGASMRTPIADRVLENYQRLRDSNRRISVDDRRRLDEHIQRIDELQRKLNTTFACADIQEPGSDSIELRWQSDYGFNPSKNREFWQLMNEVVAVGMACGTSRIATMYCSDHFSTFQGNWHQDIAHQANAQANAQQTIAQAHQRFFEDVFVDLLQRLDIEEAPGQTLLDNTLVMWTQESGVVTHDSYSIPIVTAGGAGGAFTTGNYVDYRRLSTPRRNDDTPDEPQYPGLIYGQWLGTVLAGMGVSRSSFEAPGQQGYGHHYIGQHGWYQEPGYYPNSVQSVMGEDLPWLTT